MKHFKYQQATRASQQQVWAIWCDVAHWPRWDTELEWASLTEAFTQGAQGQLKPKGSPAITFTLSELVVGESFTFTVPLPLGQMAVAHYFLPGPQTVFVHEVTFTGPSSLLFGWLLGRHYAKALPSVLQKIQHLAEQFH